MLVMIISIFWQFRRKKKEVKRDIIFHFYHALRYCVCREEELYNCPNQGIPHFIYLFFLSSVHHLSHFCELSINGCSSSSTAPIVLELDSVIFMGLVQLRIFRDSMCKSIP